MGHEDNKQNEEEKKIKSTSNDPEHQHLMEGGRNVEELVKEGEATMNLDNKKSLTLNLNEKE